MYLLLSLQGCLGDTVWPLWGLETTFCLSCSFFWKGVKGLWCYKKYPSHGRTPKHLFQPSNEKQIKGTLFLNITYNGLSSSEKVDWDFPGGAVVKNLPVNAGDTGSSPGPGGSHMPRSNWARAPQLLSLCSRACEPQLLKPTHLKPVLLNKEKPPQWEARAPHRRVAPARRNRESPRAATKTQRSQK